MSGDIAVERTRTAVTLQEKQFIYVQLEERDELVHTLNI